MEDHPRLNFQDVVVVSLLINSSFAIMILVRLLRPNLREVAGRAKKKVNMAEERKKMKFNFLFVLKSRNEIEGEKKRSHFSKIRRT